MPTELSTARLQLGPWHDDELADYTWMVHERDPRGARAPRDGRPTPDDLRVEIARQQVGRDDGTRLLVIRIDGRFLGYCGLMVGHATAAEPELAYELLRAAHGHGYATEAATAVVAAAATTGRRRLWATVRPWNHASFRVLAKAGFTASGRTTTDDFGDSVWWTRGLDPQPGPPQAR